MTKIGDLEDMVYLNEFHDLVSHSKMMNCFEVLLLLLLLLYF